MYEDKKVLNPWPFQKKKICQCKCFLFAAIRICSDHVLATIVQELRWADYQAGHNKHSTGGLGLGMGGTKIGEGLFNQNQQSTSTAGTGLFNQNIQLGKTWICSYIYCTYLSYRSLTSVGLARARPNNFLCKHSRQLKFANKMLNKNT